MGRKKGNTAQLPLTERARKPAPLARVKPRLEIVATFEPDPPKSKKGESARQLARRAALADLAERHGPMAQDWTLPRTPLERFALMQADDASDAGGLWLSTHESPDAAGREAEEGANEAHQIPIALFDLDTGDEWAPRTRVEWELEVGGEQ